jgi:hypothetical protein
VAAVPDDYIDQAWLVGPLPRIRRRFADWLDSGATGLIVRYGGAHKRRQSEPEDPAFFRAIAEAAGR